MEDRASLDMGDRFPRLLRVALPLHKVLGLEHVALGAALCHLTLVDDTLHFVFVLRRRPPAHRRAAGVAAAAAPGDEAAVPAARRARDLLLFLDVVVVAPFLLFLSALLLLLLEDTTALLRVRRRRLLRRREHRSDAPPLAAVPSVVDHERLPLVPSDSRLHHALVAGEGFGRAHEDSGALREASEAVAVEQVEGDEAGAARLAPVLREGAHTHLVLAPLVGRAAAAGRRGLRRLLLRREIVL